MTLDKARFYAALREAPFRGSLTQPQVDGIEAILRAWDRHGDGDDCKLAYCLATAYHEVGGTMQPVREGFAKSDAAARRAVNALAAKRGPKSAVARYARPTAPYGHVYYGRGFVQLTWEENYEREGRVLGLDLVRQPDLALDDEVAARILVDGMMRGRFTNRRLGDYFAPGVNDPVGARRVVNGTDKAATIAAHYRAFLLALTAARDTAPVVSPRPQPRPEAPAHQVPQPAAEPRANWIIALVGAALGAALLRILT